MSWYSGWYSSLSNRYMYEGASPPLESNMLLQRKALTMGKYMAEQRVCSKCSQVLKQMSPPN